MTRLSYKDTNLVVVPNGQRDTAGCGTDGRLLASKTLARALASGADVGEGIKDGSGIEITG